ncbi:Pre-rRNA-processing protein ESF2 [Pleurostoma richardsiae]|uniref:18S rRNA factor 2 n=1 Tax=Pleurostoma richardsiae TaxID=41990 RepID=A0AA38RCJ4_9PEZI|nr:Pre-rRNA-processing protein ESF2 [Pleurostoma richardsiae]
MAPEKRNEFLDVDESDDDVGQGYDSEADELQKGGRSSKRRKVDHEESDDEDAISNGEEPEVDDGGAHVDEQLEEDAAMREASREQSRESTEEKSKSSKVSKPLSKKNLVQTEEAIRKSGVVYLSRIPPFMKPQKLRSLLEPYGKINRTFLTPEDPAARARRLKAGGNKKHMFTEGWVEFVSKKDAKRACDLLNARTIGGKKGSYYRDDIWTLLYLKGFKWHHLTEQIAAENAERASRLRAEISKTTKENREFVRNVEKAKMLEGMQAKKAAKRKTTSDGDGDGDGEGGKAPREHERNRKFKQIPLAKKDKADQSGQVERVLSKIF